MGQALQYRPRERPKKERDEKGSVPFIIRVTQQTKTKFFYSLVICF